MNKIWIVIQREYLTRVRKKTFILSTFLTPLLFAGILIAVILITVQGSDKEVIGVIDNTGLFRNKIDSTRSVKFVVDPSADTANFERLMNPGSSRRLPMGTTPSSGRAR